MAIRTYAVGTKAGVRRLDDLTTPWIDASVLLAPFGFPITVILRDVMTDPLDSDKVFVVGDRDTGSGATGIYVSDNAGATWYQPGGDVADFVASPQFFNFWEVWVVNSNVIYACTQYGLVYKSIDAGATFNLTATFPNPTGTGPHSTGNSKALHFITEDIGVVSFDDFVYKTIDGGDTWSILNAGAGVELADTEILGIHMSADEQNITAITPRNIHRSTDSGASFASVQTFFFGGRHLTWLDDTNMFVVGIGTDRKSSTDGGATWTTVSVPDLPGVEHVAAHMYNATNGFYDQDADTMVTNNGMVFAAVSETAPYLIQAIWTHFEEPADEPCGCPDGTVYNPVTDLCEGYNYHSAISIGALAYNVAAGNKELTYGSNGAFFYESIDGKPYPIAINGGVIEDNATTPLAIEASLANDAWGDIGTPDTLNGRLNLSGVWTTLPLSGPDHPPLNTWLGFSACVNTPVAKQYYIGIAGDNRVRITLNGVVVVHLGYDGGGADQYLKWHMFPLTLPPGDNVIELEGWNNDGLAAFAAEIYDADLATLTAMTLPAQVDTVLVFSTVNKIGSPFDVGDPFGWQCPPGYILSFCDGFAQCVQAITAPFEPCGCYLATNCEDPMDQILLTTEDVLDLNLIYIFYGHPDKCWTIEVSTDCPPDDALTVVASSWASCEDCISTCYTLIDCEGIEPNIQVSNDLSQYLDPFGVGRIIQLTRCPEVCWQIVANPGHCTGAEEVVVLTDDFETCEECIGTEEEPPLLLNHRKVQPGYDTKACSTEYVEKVKCSYAEALYQEVVSERYGIEFCCEIDLRKYKIKHEDLKLRLITDPDACLRVSEDCCAPCNVTAIIIRPCPEPDYVYGRIIP